MDNDPHASLGDDYKKGLSQWCTTKKASAVFDWCVLPCVCRPLLTAFQVVTWYASHHLSQSPLQPHHILIKCRKAVWIVLLVLTALTFRRERRRDNSFVPPSSPRANSGVSCSGILAADDERYADKPEPESYFPPYKAPVAGYGYSQPSENVSSRPSLDVYGRMSADVPPPVVMKRREEPSRTLQLAFNDPCECFSKPAANEDADKGIDAQLRAALLPSSGGGYQPPVGQPLYSQGGLPDPPNYGGYR